MLTPAFYQSKFNAGQPYDAYVASGQPHERDNWNAFHARVLLSPSQRALIQSFTRTMNLLVISGLWCGDCAQQCPFFDHIARANPAKIHLRFLDRDAHADLAENFQICSGARVPVAIFLNEDFDFLSSLGDRTLARYRTLAAKNLGASCPLPGAPVPSDQIAAELADWIAEFERTQLLLRLSSKLRQRYHD